MKKIISGKFRFPLLLGAEPNFIAVSQSDSSNLHMAVVDENDTYMGTVSLKSIDLGNNPENFKTGIYD